MRKVGCGGSRGYHGERRVGDEGGEFSWGLEGQADEYGLYPGDSGNHGWILERG